jgi:hypothetical protein
MEAKPSGASELRPAHSYSNRSLSDLQLDEQRCIGYTYKCLGSGLWGLRS